MNPQSPELASQWITLLAAGMLVIQLLMVVQRMLLTNIRLFALQSLMLAGIAAIIAFFHGAPEVYLVASPYPPVASFAVLVFALGFCLELARGSAR